MSPVLRHVLLGLGLLLAWVALAGGGAKAGRDVAQSPPRATDRGTFTFAPGTHPLDAQAVRDAVARARPEAQRLVARVDGLTTITVGRPERAGAAGLAHYLTDGSYAITVDLGGVTRSLGARGVARLVLHELGHVVDDALVPDALARRLDAGVPPGYPCGTAGDDSSCLGRSAREERFAETFAKWAMDDIGVNLGIGYKVPPPSSSLATWGAPLAVLAAAG